MGKNVVILGTQWGDEGKGKIVDLLTDQAAYVARFQGGHNAGHTLVIDQPVRSGQQIYSRGDLIVLAPVSTGAELLAEGHIHVYNTLRGRALAGVRGDQSARIFCQKLDAELVSIAGIYRVAEDLPEQHRKQAVHITLDGDAMRFADLK